MKRFAFCGSPKAFLLGAMLCWVCLLAVGCSAESNLPEFQIKHDSIILGDVELAEDEFFSKIARLESKHRVVFDIYDRESSDYIRDVLLPRSQKQLEDNPEQELLVEIELREE